ncbi:OmpA family protein [Qipengyuania aquimaris]|uniref:OmpA family protein n=1 Tax=Qipengyuania aquimaris TaxID=255984 RepID=UPI001CD2E8EE|nr:OmpA family protein [Qipengyuania aquimaris]MCA0902944.1 OmpA family protein [Qipengyuania aquimaris]
MTTISKKPKTLVWLAALSLPLSASLSAQELRPVGEAQAEAQEAEVLTIVEGSVPTDLEGLPEGPEVEGFISARSGNRMQVTTLGGQNTLIVISEATEIRAKGGFLGLGSKELTASSLLNGLPVTVKTVQWGGRGLIATDVRLKDDDLETAAMIRNGTSQQFAEQREDIDANAALAESLRGRMGDIDKYNIKGSTNVFFDTGKYNLSAEARQDLCAAADQANAMDNALLLVVGYTDSTGSYEINQELSERRAGRVVNFLQQECGWQPWRMLSPTGMAASDPLADNSTPEGKAQNRRVSVNILVSKSVDGM